MSGSAPMTTELHAAKQALLALLGGRWPTGGVAPQQWPALGAMAAAHRLEPLLAWRASREGWPVPPDLARGWEAARRRAAVAALAQHASLRLALAELGAAAIPAVALKGVGLAWRSYPEPALRPMRDIDLLVPEARAKEAFTRLTQAGFAPEAADPASLAEALEHGHDLPAQRHRDLGGTIELHHRLSDPPHRRGYFTPQLAAGDVLARAAPVDCGGLLVPCPAPQDLAAHLIVHALYGHRFDCGPLVLADLHFLSAEPGIDWATLRAEATRQGWSRGFDLLLASTTLRFGPLPAVFDPPPEDVLDAAGEALLPDLAARNTTLAAADIAAARSPWALGRALARRLRPDPHVVARESGRSKLPFWPRWAARRLVRLGRGLADGRARREASAAARVMRWVQDGAQFSGD
jgi:hypothetical protein